MYKKSVIFQLIVILFLATNVFAQINSLNREYEPILIEIEDFPEILGENVDEFFVYVYQQGSDEWTQIPFQIDEKDSTGSYFAADDSLMDENDELVFMAFDLGDSAATDNWIDNDESKDNSRYEIKVVDSWDTTKVGWAYLYQSPTLEYTATDDYVDYDEVDDVVNADYFFMGYDDNGILSDMGITLEGGGSGADILDRNKQRAIVHILFWDELITEDDYDLLYIYAIDGPVRVIRYQYSETEVMGEVVPLEMEFSIYRSYFSSGEIEIEIENSFFTMEYMRISFDFNENAIGSQMYFSNDPANPVIIDGDPDVIDHSIPDPTFWIMGSGNEGSLLQIINYTPGIGNTEELYYYDNSEGGTGDDTPDTGDGVSYGDVGLSFSDLTNAGTYYITINSYMLPANTDTTVVDSLLYEFNNPIAYAIEGQTYSPSSIFDEYFVNAPQKIKLYQNYPNPFNPTTTISYQLPEKSNVNLSIYNASGQLVKKLVADEVDSGRHQVIWEGKNDRGKSVSSGIYFYKLDVSNDNYEHTEVKKCVLLK